MAVKKIAFPLILLFSSIISFSDPITFNFNINNATRTSEVATVVVANLNNGNNICTDWAFWSTLGSFILIIFTICFSRKQYKLIREQMDDNKKQLEIANTQLDITEKQLKDSQKQLDMYEISFMSSYDAILDIDLDTDNNEGYWPKFFKNIKIQNKFILSNNGMNKAKEIEIKISFSNTDDTFNYVTINNIDRIYFKLSESFFDGIRNEFNVNYDDLESRPLYEKVFENILNTDKMKFSIEYQDFLNRNYSCKIVYSFSKYHEISDKYKLEKTFYELERDGKTLIPNHF